MFKNSSSLLGFVIQHGLVTGADVAPLRELFDHRASPEQIDAFLAERTQGWATWKTWFTRFGRVEAAILADAKACQALETLAGAGASRDEVLWAVTRYIAVREYMASRNAKKQRGRAKAYGERALKRSRSLPQRLRDLADELANDPLYPWLPESVAPLWAATPGNLRALAQAIEQQPKQSRPRLRNIVRLSRRSDYTGILDGILRYLEQTTGRPFSAEVYELLRTACDAAGIRRPDLDSIVKHFQRTASQTF